jgi:hypothetical protein
VVSHHLDGFLRRLTPGFVPPRIRSWGSLRFSRVAPVSLEDTRKRVAPEARFRSEPQGSTKPPRSAIHTLRRTLLASSRTASLRPLPSCCYPASSCDRSPLPRQLRARPEFMSRASSAHCLRDNTHENRDWTVLTLLKANCVAAATCRLEDPHRGADSPAHTADEQQRGHTSVEACGAKRWSTTHFPSKRTEVSFDESCANRERESRCSHPPDTGERKCPSRIPEAGADATNTNTEASARSSRACASPCMTCSHWTRQRRCRLYLPRV